MILRSGLTAIVLGAGLLTVGCGDEKTALDASSPEKAIAEIEETRSGLDAALATFAAGDAAKADEQVGDAYLEHFEEVEGPLGKVDAELKEKIEDAIREELREKIKANAPAEEITALADEIKADLEKAEAALR